MKENVESGQVFIWAIVKREFARFDNYSDPVDIHGKI